ncbi:SCO6880 family protein [Bifidobacterium xylocopae]|uniref:PrgI family protein n=1 Tax=Bifidobacterium xylocopae TaxID=2493119 RepID=A0A366KC44_9BIFI|nr:SCO6880 family protein [Bifidobacterium xylocopae]RBP98812.1 hypothetical protein CRD59_07105 [Bifidobacterium xylocopae]
MSDDMGDAAGQRTYGNWLKPKTQGVIKGVGWLTSMMVFAVALVILIFVVAGQWITALATAGLGFAAIFLISTKDKHNISQGSKILARIGWWSAKRRRENMWRAGTLGSGPVGSVMLPGILGRVTVSEAADSYGRKFALIYCPRQQTYTVVFSASPMGEDLVDPEQVDVWVARWGLMKADMADEPGLKHFGVTIETHPANPLQLKQEVESQAVGKASPFSLAVLSDVVESYPQGSSDVKAYLFFTYSASRKGSGRRKKRDEIIQDIAPRLGHLSQRVEASGAAACWPMDMQALCRYVRVAYDSKAQADLDQADALRQPVVLDWSQCGPMAAEASWDSYLHDGDLSVTWEMTQAPRGVVRSNILTRFLAPQRDLVSKRVTWLYKPIPPEDTPDVVDKDVTVADYEMSAKRPTARARRRKRAAEQTADEQAAGAGVENFACLATATIADSSAKQDVMATVEALGASSRLRLRPVYGSQDSAFAACLPLGLDTKEYTALPASYIDSL